MKKDFSELQKRLENFEVQIHPQKKKPFYSRKAKPYVPVVIRDEYKEFLPDDYEFAYMLSDLDEFYEFAESKGYSMDRVDNNQKLTDKLWEQYQRHYGRN